MEVRYDPTEQDFGTICLCAVRYAMGRSTYMPHIVMSFVRQHLRNLDDKTLFVMERDIAEARDSDHLGHPQIDKPEWLRFLADIQKVRKLRKQGA